ncbi:MAG: hypothetical protein RIE87_11840 [Rhodospirillales bacterium]
MMLKPQRTASATTRSFALGVMLIMNDGTAEDVRAALVDVRAGDLTKWIEVPDATAAAHYLARSKDQWVVLARCDSTSALRSAMDIQHWYGRRNLSLVVLMPDLTVELVAEAYQNGVSAVVQCPGEEYELLDAFHRAMRKIAILTPGNSPKAVQDFPKNPLPSPAGSSPPMPSAPGSSGREGRFKFISEKIVGCLPYLAPREEWFSALPVEHMWPVLVELYNAQDGVPVSNLALTAGAPLSSTSRGIDKLESGGIVLRSVDGSDKRRVIVTLSEKGREQVLALTDAMYTHLSDEPVSM